MITREEDIRFSNDNVHCAITHDEGFTTGSRGNCTLLKQPVTGRIIILINPGLKRLHVIRGSDRIIRGLTNLILMAEEGSVTK